MSDEKIGVEFGAKTDGLVAGSNEASRAVRRSVDEMNESFSLIHGEVEGLEHRFEHLGVSASFAIANLAEGSERGVTRVAHALATLGFAFGGAGGVITTGLAVGAEQMVEFFSKAREEAEKTEKAFEEQMAKLANSGQSIQLQAQLKDIAFGSPFDDNGKMRKASQYVLGAFEGSLADLEAHFAALDAKIPAGATMAPHEIAAEYNTVSHALDAAREKFQQLKEAAENVKNQPADMSGLLPMHATAKADKTPEELAKEWDQAFKGIQSGIDAMGKQLDSQAQSNAQRFVNEAVRAANEDVQAHERANEQKERDRASFWQFITQLDELHAQQEKDRIRTSERQWESTFRGIQSMWSQTVQRINSGGDSIHNLWKDLWHGLVQESIAGLMRIQEAHLAHWLAVNNITAAGVAQEIGLKALAGIKSIAIDAYKAGAAAWAAISEIPIVGPFLAPALAAGTIASILSLAGNIHSASGGFDVPAGLNPMTQLHAQEMVLPAELANRVRGMTDGGGDHYHFHLHTLDTKTSKQWLHDNRREVAGAVKRAAKDGSFNS